MPKICYTSKRFQTISRRIIDHANKIITEYELEGFSLTLRQLYYQFVARDLIENTQKSYKNLGTLMNNARLAGLVDWLSLEDRTRNLQDRSHWGSPADIIKTCVSSYNIDLWQSQEFKPEVWIEKDALVGVIEDICTEWDTPYFSCRGYTSQSEMWRAARRLKRYKQYPVIIHLGDHDPSGIDMSRDIEDRLRLFGVDLKFIRIALNQDQIDEYNPPPNPTKLTDSRANNYIREYGHESWELDALNPTVINQLIEKTIQDHCDTTEFFHKRDVEIAGRKILQKVADNWGEVEDMF